MANQFLNNLRLGGAWRATAASIVVGIVGQAFLVLSGILFARILGPTNRGYLALLLLFPTVLSQLGNLGLPTAASYFIAKGHGRSSVARTVGAPLLIQAGVLLLAQSVVLFWYVQGKPFEVRWAAIASLGLIPASIAYDLGLAILQGERRFAAFNLLRLQIAVFNSVAALILFVAHRNSLLAAILLLTAAYAVSASVALVASLWRRERQTAQASPPIGALITFGIRGLLGSVYPVEVFRLDQAVVGLALSPAALGVYVTALSLTNLPRFISQSVGMVAYPRVAQEPTDARRRQAIWGFFWVAVCLSSLVVVALELLSGRLIPLFFGKAFVDAVPVARILLVGALFLSARRILAEGLRGAGVPVAGTVAEIASWVCLVPLLFLFGGWWQLNGIAVALACSAGFSLVALMVFYVAYRRRSPLPGGRVLPGASVHAHQ